jgi:hypothetical protein
MAYTFDGINKIITLSTGTVSVSVRDLWSRWMDWFLTSDNSKFLPAFKFVGGDDIDVATGTLIPIYSFLENGWKIRPQERSHTLSIGDGILLVNGGGDPFLDTIGAYTVRINYQQPVQAISFSSTGGGGSTTNMWEQVIEDGYTAEQIMRMLASVMAGKSSIVDNGNGTATIVFRDLNDTVDRVTTEVVGSSRGNPNLLL